MKTIDIGAKGRKIRVLIPDHLGFHDLIAKADGALMGGADVVVDLSRVRSHDIRKADVKKLAQVREACISAKKLLRLVADKKKQKAIESLAPEVTFTFYEDAGHILRSLA